MYYCSQYQFAFKLLVFIQTKKKMACIEAFNDMCRKIVRPTRHQFDETQMIQRKFRSSNVNYDRLQVVNSQGQKLSVIVFAKSFTQYPTILYLHGNGGHKLQSLQIAFQKINLIAFDFCGCGKSEGQYITYGEKQVEDIRAVVEKVTANYLGQKVDFPFSISMGASLATMYTSKYPRNITCLILDTPFRHLKKVVSNVAEHNSGSVPSFIITIIVFFVEMRTQSIVGSKIFGTDFSQCLSKIRVPILFAYSTKDTVVREEDVKQLYNIYNGPKSLSRIQWISPPPPGPPQVVHRDWLPVHLQLLNSGPIKHNAIIKELILKKNIHQRVVLNQQVKMSNCSKGKQILFNKAQDVKNNKDQQKNDMVIDCLQLLFLLDIVMSVNLIQLKSAAIAIRPVVETGCRPLLNINKLHTESRDKPQHEHHLLVILETPIHQRLLYIQIHYLRILMLNPSDNLLPIIRLRRSLPKHTLIPLLITILGQSIELNDLGADSRQLGVQGLEFLAVNVDQLLFGGFAQWARELLDQADVEEGLQEDVCLGEQVLLLRVVVGFQVAPSAALLATLAGYHGVRGDAMVGSGQLQ